MKLAAYVAAVLALVAGTSGSPIASSTVPSGVDGRDWGCELEDCSDREGGFALRPPRPSIPRRPGGWPDAATTAAATAAAPTAPTPSAPQTADVGFTAATVDDSGQVPPDSMGAGGPTQFLLALNGRIRTFDKTGTLDAIIDTTLDDFFVSVAEDGVCDPRVRYDRHSEHWFVTAIDHCGAATPAAFVDNHILIASSPDPIAASGWSFYSVDANIGEFNDFGTLGVDEDALYIGANVFNEFLDFVNTHAYVVRKSSVMDGATMFVTTFDYLIDFDNLAGPYSPAGVDNFDTGTNTGYFIGTDFFDPTKLALVRVTDPEGTPSISQVSISVPLWWFPAPVSQSSGPDMDGIDDRLGNAVIRDGRLWTAHSFEVDSTGEAELDGVGGRNGVRWYEIGNLSTPSLVQSGTIFDPSASQPFNYWVPSVMVSGQGHAAFGFSQASTQAGTTGFAAAATSGRVETDPAGETGDVTVLKAGLSVYDSPLPGPVERWGDYSHTSLDPNDDMTMWTVQEYAEESGKWGVYVASLQAPAPTISSNGGVPEEAAADTLVINGTGFYEPGPQFPQNLQASISGGVVVNDVESVVPGEVRLGVTTTGVAAGTYDITITNPDGQDATGTIVVGPQLSVAPETFDFGDETEGTTSAPLSLAVSNTGTAPLTVGAVEIDGDDADDFDVTSDECSDQTLEPGGSCDAGVAFSPTSPGTKSATLIIAGAGDDGLGRVVNLSGNGLAQEVTPSPEPTPTPEPTAAPPPRPTPTPLPPPVPLSGGSSGSPVGSRSTLPQTGQDIADLVRAGVTLLLVGAALVAGSLGRRRLAAGGANGVGRLEIYWERDP